MNRRKAHKPLDHFAGLIALWKSWFRAAPERGGSGLAVRRRRPGRTLSAGEEKGEAMESAFDSLVRLLEAEDVRHQVDPEHQVVMAGFRGENAMFRVYFKLDEDEGLLQLFGVVPVSVPEGCRLGVAEGIARANYGLKLGKFEMDFRDGELRFQVANVFPSDKLDDEVVKRLLGTTVHVLDRYFPAFMSIIYGNDLPEDAIAHVEHSADS